MKGDICTSSSYNAILLSFCLSVLLSFALNFQQAFAAGTSYKMNKDSLQILQILEMAKEALADQRKNEVIRLATEALLATQEMEWQAGEAHSHLILGQAYRQSGELSLGLENMLRAAHIYENLGQRQGHRDANFELGNLTMEWPAYELALKYYTNALQLTPKKPISDLIARLHGLRATVYLQKNDMQSAIKAARRAESLVEKETSELSLSVHAQLSRAYTRLNRLDSALFFALKEEETVSQNGNELQQFSAYTKVAYLYRRQGEHDACLSYLQQAQQLVNGNKNKISPAQEVRLLNNLAVTLLIKGELSQAKQYFDQSIQIAVDYRLLKEEADTHNLLAAAYLSEGKLRNAANQTDLALQLAESQGFHKAKAEAYRIKSEASLKNNDYRQSLAYEKKYYQSLEELEAQQEEAVKKLEKSNSTAEQQERTILDLIAKEENQAQQRHQLEMEAEQQRQALALQKSQVEILQQEKDLQRELLEKQKLEQLQVKQALSLSQERLEAAEREKEIEVMRQEQDRQQLLIQQQKLEEQSRLREMELLAEKNQAQDKELELEAKNSNYLLTGLLVALVLIIFILFFLYQRNRDNNKLKEQQQLIQHKNEELSASQEELKQNMDQLQFTQEVVAKQKEMLQVTGNFGVWEYSIDDEKINCNQEFLKLLGLEEEEFSEGLSFWKQRIHPDDLPGFEIQLKKCLQGEEIATLQYRITTPDNEERFVNGAMRPVYDHEILISLVGVIMDVTHVKKNESILSEKNKDLEKINSELDHFVYRTSHNLRAPLTSVMGLVNLMERIDSKEEQKEYLKHISTSMLKLDETIQEINNYSKNARLEIKPEEVELRSLVSEVYDTLLFMRGEDKVDFSLEIPKSLTIVCDVSRLKIIFNNLLSNAMKYVNPATGKCQVRVGASVLEESVEITVADKGMGIPEQYQAKIFEMFFRATNNAPGSGLGLYIVKEAVSKLDGSILLESKEGVGTTFFLSLPVHAVSKKDASQLRAV